MNELDIRQQLQTAGKERKASQIATALKIAPSTVKRWIDGGDIPAPMLTLLDLYFFGTIPFEIANQKALHGVLDFTTDQWRVIEVLSRREAKTPGQWIADKIRWMLAGDQEARNELEAIQSERRSSSAPTSPFLAKVAEEFTPAIVQKQEEA
jgi:DNA-binding MarR family transcriptional regulator